jgi:hypothetical protein
VVGRPSEFSREWAYTSLSRARARTRVYVVAEATTQQREREEYAPPEPERTRAEALEVLGAAMRRREAERLALEHADPADIAGVDSPRHVPLGQLAEAGVERARRAVSPPHERDWRIIRHARERGHDRGFER